jgi:glutamyl-tRNA reductase
MAEELRGKSVLIIGSGPMALEYIKVFDFFKFKISVISRSDSNFNFLKKNYNNIQLHKYHYLSVGEKPPYDLLICDKTKRIEKIKLFLNG